jgi:hypothetical protein
LQDLNKLIENRVKDAIAKACLRLGMDKSQVYYGIGGNGMVGPLIAENPQTGEKAVLGMEPIWQISVGVRTGLVGQEPIVGSLPIPSVFPTAAEIDFVVNRLLGELQQIKDQQRALPVAGPTMKVGK